MDIIVRLRDLADRSYQNGQYTFTDFLSMAELSDFYRYENEVRYAAPCVFGGCEMAERRMIRFGSEELLGYAQEFPITALLIRPVSEKFADDLTHRDFLGALMNLGIEREALGDIFVKEKAACLFCKETIAEYITENLTRVKHTTVSVSVTKDTGGLTAPAKEDKVIQTASFRIDAVIAKVYHLSRNEALELFPAGLVFVNGRNISANSVLLKEGDLVSVRGRGRFCFEKELDLSRKGKRNSRVSVYI